MGASPIVAGDLGVGMDEADPTVDVACTLTDDQKAARRAAVRDALVATYRGSEDREDGYTLRFDDPARSLPAVAEFTAAEHQCCSFATYAIAVEPPHETLELTITGPEGTRDVFADLLRRLEDGAR